MLPAAHFLLQPSLVHPEAQGSRAVGEGGLVAALWHQVASLQPHQECGSEGVLGLLGPGGCNRDFVVAAAAGK